MHCSGSTLFYSILRKSCSRKRKVKEINEVAMAWTLLCRFFIPISYQANFLLTIGWSCSLFSICYCSHGSWCSRVHQKHIEACWFKYWAFLYDWQRKGAWYHQYNCLIFSYGILSCDLTPLHVTMPKKWSTQWKRKG